MAPNNPVDETSKFEIEALNSHNKLRDNHGVPHLEPNNDLNKKSQELAELLANKKLTMAESSRPGVIIQSYSSPDSNMKVTANYCVEELYKEINDYHLYFGKEPETKAKIGNFTQIVWKSTKELGVGRAISKSGDLYIVFHYDPPGNTKFKYSENVLPSMFESLRSIHKYEPSPKNRIGGLG